HTWVAAPHSAADYPALAARLRAARISAAFFHAGPLGPDGAVAPERVRYAGQLLAAMARYAPGIRAQAYLGQVERRGGGPLDLGDPAARAGVVATAARLVRLGFG